MSAKNTPGPWAARRSNMDSDGRWLVEAPEQRESTGDIATVWERHDARAASNARLIAAAPDLLKLVELLAGLDIEDDNVMALGLDDAVVAARHVVTKARGEG